MHNNNFGADAPGAAGGLTKPGSAIIDPSKTDPKTEKERKEREEKEKKEAKEATEHNAKKLLESYKGGSEAERLAKLKEKKEKRDEMIVEMLARRWALWDEEEGAW